MIKTESNTLDVLIRELLAERYATTDRDRPRVFAGLDTPEALAHRRRVLNEALDGDAGFGNVVPLRRARAA